MSTQLRKIRNLMIFAIVLFILFGTVSLLGVGYWHVSSWLYPARNPVLAQAEDSPFQKVELITEDNLKLYAWYAPSKTGTAILMLHGLSANRDQFMQHTDYLLDAGYGLLMLDFRNHGDSEGERTSMGYHEIKDARVAHQFLENQDDVDRIVLWGHSMGGAVASMLMTEVDADGLFIDATFTDFPSIVRAGVEARGLTASPYTEILTTMYGVLSGADWSEVRPIDSLAHIDKPILLFHGANDPIIPIEEAYRLVEANNNIKLIVFEDGEHSNLDQLNPMRYQAEVMKYLMSLKQVVESH